MGLKGTFRVFMNCVRISSSPSKTLDLLVSIIALAKWEELNLYQPYPGDLSTWKRQREELKVISFLAAQGPQYESAKNQLLRGVELPTLNATFSRLSRIPVEADQPEDVGETVALSATIQPYPLPLLQEEGGEDVAHLQEEVTLASRRGNDIVTSVTNQVT